MIPLNEILILFASLIISSTIPRYLAPSFGQYLTKHHIMNSRVGSNLPAIFFAVFGGASSQIEELRTVYRYIYLSFLLITFQPLVYILVALKSGDLGSKWAAILASLPSILADAVLQYVAVRMLSFRGGMWEVGGILVSALLLGWNYDLASFIESFMAEIGVNTCNRYLYAIGILSIPLLSIRYATVHLENTSRSSTNPEETSSKSKDRKKASSSPNSKQSSKDNNDLGKRSESLAKTAKVKKTKGIVDLVFLLLAIFASVLYSLQQIPSCRVPGALAPKDYKVLYSEESLTGMISIVDASSSKFGTIRLLRCDHSLLGGSYLDYGNQSIFGIFYYLDFVKYFQKPDGLNTQYRSALHIGLGVGVSVKTMVESGITVDVAEIDPVVFSAALSFFNMPEPNLTYIGDGRKFIESEHSGQQYDYIVHDVFSGGLVPKTLFSVEALDLIKQRMKSHGILALNFVGNTEALSTKFVYATLKAVFKHVSIYGEDGHKNPEFLLYNLCFFASDEELVFVQPNESDISDDPAYYSYKTALKRFESNRVYLRIGDNGNSDLKEYVIRDGVNPLEKLQASTAMEHWRVMRQLYDTNFWLYAY